MDYNLVNCIIGESCKSDEIATCNQSILHRQTFNNYLCPRMARMEAAWLPTAPECISCCTALAIVASSG